MRRASSRWPTRWRSSVAAKSLVLLGDPQQLDQVVQGTHPPGAERSALAHLLGDAQDDAGGPGTVPGAHLAAAPGHHAPTPASVLRAAPERQPGNERQGLRGVGVAGRHRVALGPGRAPRQRDERAGGGGGRGGHDRRDPGPGRGGHLDGPRRRGTARRPGGHPRRDALQHPRVAIDKALAARLGRRSAHACGRHRGQVPGPGGARLHLRHGQLQRRATRRAAWSSCTR